MANTPNTIRALQTPHGGLEKVEKCLAIVGEMERLQKLTAKELIEETLATSHADNLVVIELMNRVLPGWSAEGLL